MDIKGSLMDVKGSLVIGAAIVIGSIVLGLTLGLNSLPRAQVGRFQMSGVPGHAYVVDTATGEVWENFAPSSSGSVDPKFYSVKVKVN